MSHPSFDKWRSISKGVVPTRFESNVSKFRKLSEMTTPTRSNKSKPDKRIEVDTVTTPNALNMATSVEDPAELEKERKSEQERQMLFNKFRYSVLNYIKKLARRDFNMIGGTSPTGMMSGAGGNDGMRPVSFSAKQQIQHAIVQLFE